MFPGLAKHLQKQTASIQYEHTLIITTQKYDELSMSQLKQSDQVETKVKLNSEEIFKWTQCFICESVSVSGVHVLQETGGCEWDDETDEVKGFAQFGYDGEDFMVLDLNTFTWNALRPEVVPAKPILEADPFLRGHSNRTLTNFCPDCLKTYVEDLKNILRKGRIT
uniref:MHC class I-like antigen recognition-like domain-containing protein n=1 Tax=Sparus aurata TaxID=8175 RepID=A0A671TJV5_SPAAU